MKYQAQVRTILWNGEWSNWDNVGDPMTEKERLDFLALQNQVAPEFRPVPVEFRFVQVSITAPSVFTVH